MRRQPQTAGRATCSTLVVALLACAQLAADSPSLVRIDGGPNETGGYTYRISNLGQSPIVFVEIPHYLADQFNTPPGWKQQTTYRSDIGVEKRPGLCSATAESPSAAIAPGESAEFSLRMGKDGSIESRKGKGTVRIRFADNQSVSVDGVSVPVQLPRWENYGLIAGYVVIALLLLAIFARRRPRSPGPPSAPVAPSAPN